MKGQIITVALILLEHTFLTPAVQAIGFDYYNDHGVMSYGKGYWGDKKIIAQFPEMSRADLRLVKNISGKTGYIPSDEISIKNEEYHWVTDGRVILWRGKIVSNPPGPPLSILPAFRLWAASRSINIASILTDSAPKVIAARHVLIWRH